MALSFNTEECISAATDLETAILAKVKNAYESESADYVYTSYEKIKEKFEPFINSVADCGNFLRNEVATAYTKLEKTVESKVE